MGDKNPKKQPKSKQTPKPQPKDNTPPWMKGKSQKKSK